MMRGIFCQKCHRLAAQVVEDKEKVKITQNGRTLISMNKGSNSEISIKCPAGHSIKVKV